eukprot:SAG22_NODE_5028_length_1103_cov_1.893426_1_plen_312_part_01
MVGSSGASAVAAAAMATALTVEGLKLVVQLYDPAATAKPKAGVELGEPLLDFVLEVGLKLEASAAGRKAVDATVAKLLLEYRPFGPRPMVDIRDVRLAVSQTETAAVVRRDVTASITRLDVYVDTAELATSSTLWDVGAHLKGVADAHVPPKRSAAAAVAAPKTKKQRRRRTKTATQKRQSATPARTAMAVTAEVGRIGVTVCHGTASGAQGFELACPGATVELLSPDAHTEQQVITFKGLKLVSKGALGELGLLSLPRVEASVTTDTEAMRREVAVEYPADTVDNFVDKQYFELQVHEQHMVVALQVVSDA